MKQQQGLLYGRLSTAVESGQHGEFTERKPQCLEALECLEFDLVNHLSTLLSIPWTCANRPRTRALELVP